MTDAEPLEQARAWAQRLGRDLAARWFAPEAVGLRQVPVTVSVLVSALILWVTIEPVSRTVLATAAALVLGVQAVASRADWTVLAPAWRYAVPVVQMLAVALMDLGAGLDLVSLDVLLFMPVVTLALEPGPWGLGIALFGSAMVLLAPVVFDIGRVHPLLHVVVTLPIIAAVAVRAHGILGITRQQAEELRQARDEVAARVGQLRASRDALRSVMRAATEQAIIGTDLDGVVRMVSAGAERMFARAEDELVGSAITALLPVEGADAEEPAGTAQPLLAAEVGEAATGGSHSGELRRTRADGSVQHLAYVVTPRPALEGAAPELSAGYLFVVSDVTEIREHERRQDEFISLVSHEFRTPLASILGYLDLLRLESGGLDEEQLGYLDVLVRNTERLRSLVDDLLTSAQLVFGAPMTATEVEVTDVVRAAVETQQPTARDLGVRVEVAGDPVVRLISDPQRLGQVVDNLLSNAVKYSHNGGRVEITTVQEEAANGVRQARIRVADQGTGIERDELGRITERFYRTRDTRRRRVQGIGLGLSLVHAIIEEHGGVLTIDSAPGRGTVVEAVIPDLQPAGVQSGAPS
ncbi:sensor histidine kinase [Nocardioides houyundeii]|uniref:sensor histidine kinase n=1 Tax=Nocardioides houyundeii TaxID=2045452 RepID=UPI000C7818A3|nr:PAS domain-containing sensor histidine kinase [Nocardioides houyundeii]